MLPRTHAQLHRRRFTNQRINATIKAMTTAQNSTIRNIPPIIGVSGQAQTPSLTPAVDEIERVNLASLLSFVRLLAYATPCFQPIFTSHQFIG
jgi:hypothetical protein